MTTYNSGISRNGDFSSRSIEFKWNRFFEYTLPTWSKKDSPSEEWTARPALIICLPVLISSTLKSRSISIPSPSPFPSPAQIQDKLLTRASDVSDSIKVIVKSDFPGLYSRTDCSIRRGRIQSPSRSIPPEERGGGRKRRAKERCMISWIQSRSFIDARRTRDA